MHHSAFSTTYRLWLIAFCGWNDILKIFVKNQMAYLLLLQSSQIFITSILNIFTLFAFFLLQNYSSILNDAKYEYFCVFFF